MPKCKIFDPLDSCSFYTTKPICVGDLGLEIKNCSFGRLSLVFEVFGENSVLAHAEYAQKAVSW
jgi:hypothetical protein